MVLNSKNERNCPLHLNLILPSEEIFIESAFFIVSMNSCLASRENQVRNLKRTTQGKTNPTHVHHNSTLKSPFSSAKPSVFSCSTNNATAIMPHTPEPAWVETQFTGSSIFSLIMASDSRHANRPPKTPITSPSHGRAKAQMPVTDTKPPRTPVTNVGTSRVSASRI